MIIFICNVLLNRWLWNVFIHGIIHSIYDQSISVLNINFFSLCLSLYVLCMYFNSIIYIYDPFLYIESLWKIDEEIIVVMMIKHSKNVILILSLEFNERENARISKRSFKDCSFRCRYVLRLTSVGTYRIQCDWITIKKIDIFVYSYCPHWILTFI